jgi:hypothetical protein
VIWLVRLVTRGNSTVSDPHTAQIDLGPVAG